MALKNKNTGEYIKIDYGYMPMPIAKLFKSEQSRIDFDPEFDKYKEVPFDVNSFNDFLAVKLDTEENTLLNKFKKAGYEYLKNQLNSEEINWEDC